MQINYCYVNTIYAYKNYNIFLSITLILIKHENISNKALD